MTSDFKYAKRIWEHGDFTGRPGPDVYTNTVLLVFYDRAQRVNVPDECCRAYCSFLLWYVRTCTRSSNGHVAVVGKSVSKHHLYTPAIKSRSGLSIKTASSLSKRSVRTFTARSHFNDGLSILVNRSELSGGSFDVYTFGDELSVRLLRLLRRTTFSSSNPPKTTHVSPSVPSCLVDLFLFFFLTCDIV